MDIKKILALTVLILALFACGNAPQQTTENTGAESTERITEEATSSVTYETTDKNSIEESTEITTNDVTDTSETDTTTLPVTDTDEILATETTEAPTTETTIHPITEESREETTETTMESSVETTEILSTETPSAQTTETPATESIEESTTETTEESTIEENTTEEETTEDKQSAHAIIEANKTKLAPGEEFTLTIFIKNNPGIYSFAFHLPIDTNAFEFVSADKTGSVLSSFGICAYDESTASYKFNGLSTSPFNNITADGKIVTVTLKVKNNAPFGNYTFLIDIDHKNVINVDSDIVKFEDAEISINVSN